MNALFGTKYFAFIASSYAITFVVLVFLTVWIVLTYKKRQRDLAMLEAAGLRRAGAKKMEESEANAHHG